MGFELKVKYPKQARFCFSDTICPTVGSNEEGIHLEAFDCSSRKIFPIADWDRAEATEFK